MPDKSISENNRIAKKTYFGLAALMTALVSVLFLGGFFLITVLNISPGTFFTLNNLTTLIYCTFTPITLILGVIGLLRRNDSKSLSAMALVLVGLPFLILFWQFVSYFIPPQR